MLIEDNKIRWWIIALTLLVAFWWLLPNFFNKTQDQWWLAKEKLIYGLDIQGGLHLVLGVNVKDVFETKKIRVQQTIVELLKKDNIALEDHSINDKGWLIFKLKDPSQAGRVSSIIEDTYQTQFQVLRSSGGVLELDYSRIEKDLIKKQIVDQSIEVIRNRVDEFGVSEPLITAQGTDRILVQLPGVSEAKRAKDLIKKTAHLEMSLVSEKISGEDLYVLITKAEKKGKYSFEKLGSYKKYKDQINKDLKAKLPKNTYIAFRKDESSRTLSAGLIPMLLETDTKLSGDILEDASVGPGQYGQPVVNFKISVEGRQKFFEITSNNQGRLLAAVLDGVIKSAPSIEGPIFDRGQITLGSGAAIQEEATNLSITLRAGALPASLEQLEERTVGPTLGRDMIQKGRFAGLIAIGLVILFLLLFYKTLGLIANIALFFNVVLLIAFLTSFGATLTLPGVAGIILTVGMAVDANIIIFERLKEELKKGSGMKLAISEGFGRAFSAILDANITTAIVCIILMYFGTGPIRGFAVTLFFGIITSVFTAIFLSRTILNTLVHRFKLKTLG